MSRYTMSIQEILQSVAGNEDLWTPDQMYEYASQALFGEEVNFISDEYRKHFITAFAYHYFLEEIGLETFGLWRMRLAGRIYENYEYINHVYDLIGKEIFSQYSVKHKAGKSSDNGNTSKSGNNTSGIKIENTGSSSGKSDSTGKDNSNTTNDLHSVTTYDSQQKNTGTTTNKSTGSVTDSHTGTDVVSDTGTTNNEHTGTDKVNNTGTIETSHTGKDTATDTGNVRDDLNEVTITSDTPMGDLENMIHSPHTSAAGTGVDYATNAGTEYNYMSDASEHDYTNVQTNNNSQETIYDTTDTQTDNTESATTYNSTQLQTDDREQTSTYNSQTEQSRDTTDTQLDDTTSAHTGSDSEANTGTQTVAATSEDHATSSEQHSDVTSTNKVDVISESGTVANEHADSEDSNDYSVTYDMILRMEPLMRKIWDLFDSLFMQLL